MAFESVLVAPRRDLRVASFEARGIEGRLRAFKPSALPDWFAASRKLRTVHSILYITALDLHHKITSQTRTSFWGTTKWGVSGAICIFCDILSGDLGDVFSSGVYFFGVRKQISTLVESNELYVSATLPRRMLPGPPG